MFGENAPSAFVGNLIDLHVNGGASVFSVNANGGIISAVLGAGTSPVCPNGTGGALTTVGCASGGGTYSAVTSPITAASSTLQFSASLLNYGGNGNGSTDNSTAMTSACASNSEVWLPAGAYAFTSNYAVSCGLHFGAGATLVAPTGITVTVNGKIDAPTVPIFTVAGTGKFLIGPGTPVDYAEWFGAKGDNSTDDTMALSILRQQLHGRGCL